MEEAIRLLESAQKSVQDDEEDEEKIGQNKVDVQGKILEIIKRACKYDPHFQVKRTELEKNVFSKGFTNNQLNNTLKTYSNLNILMLNEDNNIITYLNN